MILRTEVKETLAGFEEDFDIPAFSITLLNLLGIGERVGGGIPDIYQVWADQGWNSPVVEEFYNPDRTRLSLDFRPKQAKKTSEEERRLII